MPVPNRDEHDHRRAFLGKTLGTTASLLVPTAHAAPGNASRHDAMLPAEPPLPPGVVARYGSSRFRSPTAIETLVFTPDSTRLISVALALDQRGYHVTSWDILTGQPIAEVTLRLNPPNRLTMLMTGTRCFCPTSDELLIGWSENRGRFRIDRIHISTGVIMDTRSVPWSPEMIRIEFSNEFTTIVKSRVTMTKNRSFQAELQAENVSTGELLWKTVIDTQTEEWLSSLEFSVDGRLLALAAGPLLWLLDGFTGKVIQQNKSQDGQKWENNVFDSTGRWVVLRAPTTNGSGNAIWDLTTNQIRHLEGPAWYGKVVICDEGLILSDHKKVGVWSAATGKLLREIPLMNDWFPWVSSSDGRLAARAFGGSIGVWDTRTGKPWDNSSAPLGDILDLRYSSSSTLSGRLCLRKTLGDQINLDGGRVTWDTRTHQPIAPTTRLPFPELIDVSPDGRTAVALRPLGGFLEFRDARTQTVLRSLESEYPTSLFSGIRFSGDSTRFIAPIPSSDQLQVWEVATGKSRFIAMSPKKDQILSLQFTISGSHHAAAVLIPSAGRNDMSDSDQIAVVDLSNDRIISRFDAPGTVTALALTGDCRSTATITSHLNHDRIRGKVFRSESATVHDTATGERLTVVPLRQRLKHLDPDAKLIALSPDGRTLLTVEATTVIAWEVATGQERIRYPHRGEITAIAVRTDGRAIAIASRDAPVWEWDYLNAPPSAELESVDVLMRRLSDFDAGVGFEAIRALIRMPEPTCRWLRDRMPPVPLVNPAMVTALIEQLDDRLYRRRESAQHALEALDGGGLSQLRAALPSASPEAKARLQRVIDTVAPARATTHHRLRMLRILEVVESLAIAGHAQARTVIEHWSAGDPEARLTMEAIAVRERMTAMG